MKYRSLLYPTFPRKLFFLIDKESSDIIAWQPHGLSFKIQNKKKFSEETIPKYFKNNSKLASFYRQLHLYGFKRIMEGPDQGAFFHAKFQRGRPDLLAEIRRMSGKGTSSTSDKDDTESKYESVESKTGKNKHFTHPPHIIDITTENDFDDKSSHQDAYPTSISHAEGNFNPFTSYPNQILPSNKMANISMNTAHGVAGITGEIRQDQRDYQPSFRIRWIPVLEGPGMPVQDFSMRPMNMNMNLNMMTASMAQNGEATGISIKEELPSDTLFSSNDIRMQQSMHNDKSTISSFTTNANSIMSEGTNETSSYSASDTYTDWADSIAPL